MGLLKKDLEQIIKTAHHKVGFFCVECAERRDGEWFNVLAGADLPIVFSNPVIHTSVMGNVFKFKIEFGVTVPANHIA